MTIPLAISFGLLALAVLVLLVFWLRGDDEDDDPMGDGKP